MTLNCHYPLYFTIHNRVFFGVHHENLKEGLQNVTPVTFISGNVRFVRIFVGFLGQEASNESGVLENGNFQGFWSLYPGPTRPWHSRNQLKGVNRKEVNILFSCSIVLYIEAVNLRPHCSLKQYSINMKRIL